MPLQVGSSCYATAAEAGGAACSQFVPVSSIDASGVRSVSCVQSDAQTGALMLQIALTPTNGITVYSTISQLPAFPPCIESDYVQAVEQVFGAFLALWAICYGCWLLYQRLNWSRGDV